MRVFVSHSSSDKPAVEALALALQARGIEVWLDKWEIGPGDDIVASINAGLDAAGCGIIVFSSASRESRWVEAEVSSDLRPHPGKQGADPCRYRRRRLRSAVAAPARPTRHRRGRGHRRRRARAQDAAGAGPAGGAGSDGAGADHTASRSGRRRRGRRAHRRRDTCRGIARGIAAGRGRGAGHVSPQRRYGLRRDASSIERRSVEAGLAELGRGLAALCLPGGAGSALTGLVDGAPTGTTVEVCFEADDAEMLGLPFEALRLPDDRLLATQAAVVVLRRPLGPPAGDAPALAGPLKILVAVGAPDEQYSGSAVLDQERELQTILDAVEPAQRHENVEVRILEVGHPEQIGKAIEADAYHVLHLSCHGLPGALELEDEDGRPVRVTADELIEPIRQSGRPLPLVLLNACHGGVQAGQTASLAEALLRAGVPCVLAMQTSVSDFYASRLAGAFYEHLARREVHLASRALAHARKQLEKERRQAIERGAPLAETQPEYATATLYVRGEEPPLADFALDKQALTVRPVYHVAGPVPHLGTDDLIGRRRELRETLRTLRDTARQSAGVVLTGIGGVGKSAVAGRAMVRLAEDGWLIPAHAGRFDVAAIARAVGVALLHGDKKAQQNATLLLRADLDDQSRLQLVAQALGQQRMVLVLDDFEQNLKPGGGVFLDDDIESWLYVLAGNARAGRLLITSRHPVPAADHLFRSVRVGPLSLAESRKLLLRLPALKGCDTAELAQIVRVIGGHPRMLEFLDGLLRGRGRLPHVTRKLQEVARDAGLDLDGDAIDGLDEGLRGTILLGGRDVLLQDLLALAEAGDADEALLQLAVSNLPMTTAGLARALAGGEAEGDGPAVMRARPARRDVPRPSLRGRRRLGPPLDGGGPSRAGRYRWAPRPLRSCRTVPLVAGAERESRPRRRDRSGAQLPRRGRLRRRHPNRPRLLRCYAPLPADPEHRGACGRSPGKPSGGSRGLQHIADEEVQAHRALGFTERAFARYRGVLQRNERLAAAEPDRAHYQRELSVSYIKMGDLYRALGEGGQARQAYLKALEIAARLAAAEPDRADYRRDLGASYNRVGDIYGALGEGGQARQAYLKALEIAERLAAAEPDRADYQRDQSVSYSKMGDLSRALGQGAQARQAYLRSLEIAERLAAAEPDRADYQRDLSLSYNKVGDLSRALGQGAQARQAYEKALEIRARLAATEPDRADYQRDLSVSYSKMGDLYGALGQGAQARQAYLRSLEIAERLAAAEPDRADYQRDLSVSYDRVGDLYGALGQGAQARQAYLRSLEIAERLAAAEPDRADYQRDLGASYNKVGDVSRALGQGAQARQAYEKALEIRARLAATEPDRADYQRDLGASYNCVGDLYRALGQGAQARQAYENALDIFRRLAAAEPDRADYQRDLGVSYDCVGDLYRALGQGAQARQAYENALDIFRRLAAAEPDRADYQHDLSVSYERVGDVYGALGQGEQARQAYLNSLEIRERLAAAEPDRADHQRDIVASLLKLADAGGVRTAVAPLSRALQIVNALAAEGRLAPGDTWMPDELRRRLQAARAGD